MSLMHSSEMPFGAHKGKLMIEIPASYFLWLYKERYNDNATVKSDDVGKYIKGNLEILKEEDRLSKKIRIY